MVLILYKKNPYVYKSYSNNNTFRKRNSIFFEKFFACLNGLALNIPGQVGGRTAGYMAGNGAGCAGNDHFSYFLA
jgi:hypothetical protein